MQRHSGGGRGQNSVPSSQRQNEYFVPRDGIDREVITADICRYLGNDALVRPGVYEDNGRSIHGYFITAYRNLTTAMIADLKADSARWDQERRKHQQGGGRYEQSQYHDARQSGYASGASARDQQVPPRYPGSDAPGYSGGVGSAPSYEYGGQAGFGQSAPYQPPQQPGFTQLQPDPRYGSGGPSGFPAGYAQPVQDAPYYAVGSNYPVNATEPYSRDTRMDTSGSGRPGYSSGQQAAYPPTSGPGAFGYQQAPAPSAGFAQPQQAEHFYGRGGYKATNPPTSQAASDFGNSNAAGFAPVPDSQYGETPTPRSTASPSASAQAQTTSSGSSRRERERERDDRPADKHARHHYTSGRR